MTQLPNHQRAGTGQAVWLVQAPERPGPRDPRTDYRHGFFTTVEKHFPDANVVILEPHPVRHCELEELWNKHLSAQVLQAAWCEQTDCSGEHILFQVTTPSGELIVAEDDFYARRFDPAGQPATLTLPCCSIAALLNTSHPKLLSLDAAVQTQVSNLATTNRAVIDELVVTTIDAPDSQTSRVEHLLVTDGFRTAGRPWGVAGSGSAWRRTNALSERAASASKELPIRTGQILVQARERLPLGSRRVALGRRIAASIEERQWSPRTIDPSFGQPLEPIRPTQVEDAILSARSADREFEIVLDEPDPYEIARECFAEFGAFPISFSYPGVIPLKEPSEKLSPIIPGFPYTFHDNAEYMRHYAACSMAITHRKAGWDCFRHVEIGASGAIPLMPDAHEIPRYAMTHYPKRAFAQIAENVSKGGTPGLQTRRTLRDHFTRYQTTQAMARYILRMSGNADTQKVLFVDDALANQADYLSALSLIGFKEILGADCAVPYPIDYLYRDFIGQEERLYGRGFGYSRLLPPSLRSKPEIAPEQSPDLRSLASTSDVVVVGSAYRNMHLVRQLTTFIPPSQLVLLYGEDTPPTMELFRELTAASAAVFIRPIHG